MPLDIQHLRSPDDASPLQRGDGCLVDRSGNRYPVLHGVPDLRPQQPVKGSFTYQLPGHDFFRAYPYARGFEPVYPETMGRGRNEKEANLDGIIPPVRPDEGHPYCLDHGCGSGKLRGYAELLGYTYVGVDNETGVTTEQGGGEGFRGGATHLCDLHRLPFRDNLFRFAFSYSVFEHLQNPFVGAAELFRVMKPGGVCFVGVASIVPFHMDSFYHHTHFGVLSTFHSAGFDVQQIAGANWNAFVAIAAMDGLPGPRWLRLCLSGAIYRAHRVLWRLRTRAQGRNEEAEELRRHLMMAGLQKAVLVKPMV